MHMIIIRVLYILITGDHDDHFHTFYHFHHGDHCDNVDHGDHILGRWSSACKGCSYNLIYRKLDWKPPVPEAPPCHHRQNDSSHSSMIHHKNIIKKTKYRALGWFFKKYRTLGWFLKKKYREINLNKVRCIIYHNDCPIYSVYIIVLNQHTFTFFGEGVWRPGNFTSKSALLAPQSGTHIIAPHRDPTQSHTHTYPYPLIAPEHYCPDIWWIENHLTIATV